MRPNNSDHRTRITKMLIRKAFMDLLSKKPIHSISIKELCETASINRGTFYKHYTDLYDLLHQIEEEMLEDFQNALKSLFVSDSAEVTPVDITTEIFRCLKENADICTVTLSEYGDKTFALKLINLGREKCVQAYSQYFSSATPKQIEYFYAFVSAGCIGLLQKWLSEGMATDAGEIATMAQDIMLKGISWLNQEP